MIEDYDILLSMNTIIENVNMKKPILSLSSWKGEYSLQFFLIKLFLKYWKSKLIFVYLN